LLQDNLVLQARKRFKILQVEKINLQQVIIYGEYRRNAKVTPETGVQAIQTGVHYSPNIEYSGFDIAFVENDCNPEKVYLYCDSDKIK
jgi:hypothetical protein